MCAACDVARVYDSVLSCRREKQLCTISIAAVCEVDYAIVRLYLIVPGAARDNDCSVESRCQKHCCRHGFVCFRRACGPAAEAIRVEARL